MLIKLLGLLWTWLYHLLKDIISVGMIALLRLRHGEPGKCRRTKGLLWRRLPCLFSDSGVSVIQLRRDKACGGGSEPTQFGGPQQDGWKAVVLKMEARPTPSHVRSFPSLQIWYYKNRFALWSQMARDSSEVKSSPMTMADETPLGLWCHMGQRFVTRFHRASTSEHGAKMHVRACGQ